MRHMKKQGNIVQIKGIITTNPKMEVYELLDKESKQSFTNVQLTK